MAWLLSLGIYSINPSPCKSEEDEKMLTFSAFLRISSADSDVSPSLSWLTEWKICGFLGFREVNSFLGSVPLRKASPIAERASPVLFNPTKYARSLAVIFNPITSSQLDEHESKQTQKGKTDHSCHRQTKLICFLQLHTGILQMPLCPVTETNHQEFFQVCLKISAFGKDTTHERLAFVERKNSYRICSTVKRSPQSIIDGIHVCSELDEYLGANPNHWSGKLLVPVSWGVLFAWNSLRSTFLSFRNPELTDSSGLRF